MTFLSSAPVQAPSTAGRFDAERVSTRFGLVFTLGQVAVLVAMAALVLPHGGSPTDPALQRGQNVHAADSIYRAGNYVFMISGSLLLGFLGAVHARLRRVDPSQTLATVATAAGALLALIWPLAGMLHDVALETGAAGADLRILAGWDAVAPYSLAFSVFARVFFIGAIVLGPAGGRGVDVAGPIGSRPDRARARGQRDAGRRSPLPAARPQHPGLRDLGRRARLALAPPPLISLQAPPGRPVVIRSRRGRRHPLLCRAPAGHRRRKGIPLFWRAG